jgi:hypothetical protein
MRHGQPRRSRLPRWPYLVALGLATAALMVRYAVIGGAAAGATIQVLRGTTGQGNAFELVLERGRVSSLKTRVSARCAGGTRWQESWAPTNGVEVHVTTAGRAFFTVERDQPTYPNGIVGRVAFTFRGTFTGRSSAQGTIRLVGRFYRREQESNACDSLDVAWAVGQKASVRLKKVSLGHQVGSYYPAVPSLAVSVSAARQRFINAIDATCVNTYDWMDRAERAAEFANQYFDDRQIRDDAFYVDLHAWQLDNLLTVGEPPQARALYDDWVANFRARLAIERTALALERRGQWVAAHRELGLLVGLRDKGNLAGQEFGLVRCTSNGERTEIPILNDGQPRPLP